MAGWRGFIANLKDATSQRADWYTPLVLLIPDSNTLIGILQDYAQRETIGAINSTDINFTATDLTRRPIRVQKDGRFCALTALPTAVTLSGGAGTKYIYADLGTPAADHSSAVTLVASTTAPASESTEYRKFLGSVGWDGAAILAGSVVPYAGAAATTIPRSYLAGLGLTNNGSDANNDLDIAAGVARDSTDLDALTLSATLTKQLDAAWAVGTNQGGLDTGAKGASTWYHVWLIKRPDTGVVDALFSTSATAPTMPANYTLKRRIGAVLTNGSSNLIAFTQAGDKFRWTSSVSDINATNPGTSAVTRTLTVPTGVIVDAWVLATVDWGTSSGSKAYLSPLIATDEAVTTTVANISSQPATAGRIGATELYVLTNTSAQIRSRLSASGASDVLHISTIGWLDRRGRDA